MPPRWIALKGLGRRVRRRAPAFYTLPVASPLDARRKPLASRVIYRPSQILDVGQAVASRCLVGATPPDLRAGPPHCDALLKVASKIFPMLSCGDLTRSLAFYADVLGGVESYRFPEAGEPAFIALTIGESSEIGLGRIAAEPLHGRQQRPACGHRVELCVYVNDVDDVFARARARGVETVADPADMPWGERTAWLADPTATL